MHLLLWIYLAGLVLRAFLAHGAMQNPTVRACNVDGQVLSCILWPLTLIKFIFQRD